MKTDDRKLVTFRLGEALFAADIHAVERVLRYVTPNTVPDTPEWIAGVIDHAKKVIPVVDLRRRIELPDHSITPSTRILILTTSDGAVGAIVDAVLEVTMVKEASVSPPPALFHGLASKFISGVAKVHDELIVVLDVDRVLTSADRLHFERVVDAAAGAGARG